ncbi:hypothetical protein SAMN05421780_101724 [Flexibacter flexilis DSM 6793]|uniref:Dolichyl-phosphate-mannose-protein mannosyltransferase n=1 Tax=Flexibacter flexilis DSM 6793 TaxID=927664 RepID=A0A1I1EH51_9BACT|nr:hypothetical protein [Flexibacter flexilis]SFB84263.1 hypothetical protein SAMN05421780_101724 [Flexibacter flexilis DSM 6793]
MQLNRYILLFIFTIINSFFIVKYGSRQHYLSEYILGVAYSIGVLLTIFFFTKQKIKENYSRILFFGLTVLVLTSTVLINKLVDANSLNVDRCSAMSVGVEALLNGQYPYSAIDHLGGRTSNLPTLLFIGIPFYLLGDVGYLQTFGFGLMACLIFYFFNNYPQRLLALLLLISSPAYWWEIYAKSDLMSNFIILLAFIFVAQKYIFANKETKIIPIAVASSALVLTRLTSIIPLSLLLCAWFFGQSIKQKSIFIFSGIITLFVLLYLCFMHVPNLDYLQKYNPFELQNRQMPTALNIAFVLLPFIYSFYIKNTTQLQIASTYFLLLPILISFVMSVFKNGIYPCIVESYFDISYFNMVLPFIIVNLAQSYETAFNQTQ